jgi:hypothetical protein
MRWFKKEKPRARVTELEDLMEQVRSVRKTAAAEAAANGLEAFLLEIEQDRWPSDTPRRRNLSEKPVAPKSTPNPRRESPSTPAASVDEHEAMLAAELERYLAREAERENAYKDSWGDE